METSSIDRDRLTVRLAAQAAISFQVDAVRNAMNGTIAQNRPKRTGMRTSEKGRARVAGPVLTRGESRIGPRGSAQPVVIRAAPDGLVVAILTGSITFRADVLLGDEHRVGRSVTDLPNGDRARTVDHAVFLVLRDGQLANVFLRVRVTAGLVVKIFIRGVPGVVGLCALFQACSVRVAARCSRVRVKHRRAA